MIRDLFILFKNIFKLLFQLLGKIFSFIGKGLKKLNIIIGEIKQDKEDYKKIKANIKQRYKYINNEIY